MQRVHIVSGLAAILVVALLLFGRGSDEDWVTVEEPALAPADRAGPDDVVRGGDLEGRSGAGGTRRGAATGSPQGRSASAASGTADRRLGSDASNDNRGVVVAGEGRGNRANGVLGDAVGGRAADRIAGSASVRGGGDPGRAPSGGGRDRADVNEFLADPAKGGAPADDGEAPEDENGVVLSVPLDRDSGASATDATQPIAEQDLEPADDGVGMRFEPGSVLAFPNAGNIRGDSGTLQLDVQPEWEGGEEGDFSLVNVRTPNDPRNLLRLFKNGRYLRFMFADESGVERDISAAIDDWGAGEVRTITATWGDGRTALYVNGQLVGQNSYDGPLEIHPGTPLYLGSDVPEAGPKGAGSTISNFQVFGRALAGDEVASR